MNDTQFVMPHLFIGCPVEASVGKSRGPYSLGLVMRPKNNSADILLFGSNGSIGMMFNCWHHDDPRVDTAGPDAWEDNTRGTWRLTEGEIRQRQVVADLTRLGELEHTAISTVETPERRHIFEEMAALALRIRALEEVRQQPRRGRPPKGMGLYQVAATQDQLTAVKQAAAELV